MAKSQRRAQGAVGLAPKGVRTGSVSRQHRAAASGAAAERAGAAGGREVPWTWLSYLLREWAVIRGAPAILAAAIVATAAVMYFLLSLHYGERLQTLEAHKAFLEDRIKVLEETIKVPSS